MAIETATPQASKRLTIVKPTATPRSHAACFAEAVRKGLLARPKTLPWQFFYDERGSELFEQICELPEYYLTRTEDAILGDHARAMVAGWTEAPTLIELGSGSATKTQRLIAAAIEAYGTIHYVPVDVSASALEGSSSALVEQFPALRVTGHVADYQGALAGALARIEGPKLILFLGSSLGNYATDEAVALLTRVARIMRPGDRLLLGTDLAKDRATLEAAYDDAQGVTAAFNRNILVRINRELGADFDVDRFAHRAIYCPDSGRVEMRLVAGSDQVVRIPGADLTARFLAGESIHTESSHKYTPEGLGRLAECAGLCEEASWTDRRGQFRVQRWRLREPHL